MERVYLLSYMDSKSYKNYLIGSRFCVKFNGYYKGTKISHCELVLSGKCMPLRVADLNKIFVFDVHVDRIDKKKIIGTVKRLKVF